MQNKISKLEHRKDQIINASFRCFSRYGYNKTTMDDIANYIGIKKASLYYYFNNKEAIFIEMMETEVNEFLKIVDERLSHEVTSSGKLICFIKGQLEFFRNRASYFDLSIQSILETQPIMDKLFHIYRKKYIYLIANIISGGIQSGEFKKCNANDVAEAIRSIVESLKIREIHFSNMHSAAEIDYAKLENKAVYILDLLINGIKRRV